jgi:hypothetical protein
MIKIMHLLKKKILKIKILKKLLKKVPKCNIN